MRISDLSRASGISIPTIKYYLREGLLPPGAPTGPNQASYDEHHLHRLRLIRSLVDVGGLSIAAARDVLAAIDEPDRPLHDVLGAGHHAITNPLREGPDRTGQEAWQAARAEAARLIGTLGWHVAPHAPALDQLADVLAALTALRSTILLASFDVYAAAAAAVAERDVDSIAELAAGAAERTELVEGVVIGTVIGEAMFGALRRLAQEDASARRFAGEGASSPTR